MNSVAFAWKYAFALDSGLKPGAQVPAFDVVDVSGPNKGKQVWKHRTSGKISHEDPKVKEKQAKELQAKEDAMQQDKQTEDEVVEQASQGIAQISFIEQAQKEASEEREREPAYA